MVSCTISLKVVTAGLGIVELFLVNWNMLLTRRIHFAILNNVEMSFSTFAKWLRACTLEPRCQG